MKGGGVKLGHKREEIEIYQAKNISLLSTANNPSLVICVFIVDNCPIDLFSLSIT
jgi:hypothetical protein